MGFSGCNHNPPMMGNRVSQDCKYKGVYFVKNVLPVNQHFSFRRSLSAWGLSLSLGGCLSGCQQAQPAAQSTQPATPSLSPSPEILAPTQPLTAVLSTPNPIVGSALNTFLDRTVASGALRQTQGVWIQSGNRLLANHQGTVPLSAASLTKAATSLAVLETLGPNYRYQTTVGTIGSIQNGVLNGDLVIQGGQNPFFVWEDAIALANQLQQLGIREVKGNLVILGPFYMNFETQAIAAGTFLKQGLDSSLWPAEALQQYQSLPPGTPQPQLAISGSVVAASAAPKSVRWIAQHQSFPMADLLKKMNRYSNNAMAEIIASSIGGAKVVQEQAIVATGVPATEIQLVNGSGLAIENRMSPRAACALFLAIDRLLKPQGMGVADIFTIVGTDESVLDQRSLPKQSVLKSGTLDTVSALAGTLATQKFGTVWFAVLDNDGNVDTFRNHQEQLLETLQQSLGAVAPPSGNQPLPQPDVQTYAQLWKRL
jgi:serine-type D-Ala-D-Ala carboxypeptidase/endopeptidase (penicillin-binding protein 4)